MSDRTNTPPEVNSRTMFDTVGRRQTSGPGNPCLRHLASGLEQSHHPPLIRDVERSLRARPSIDPFHDLNLRLAITLVHGMNSLPQ